MTRFFHLTMTLVVLSVLAISAYGMCVSGIRVQFHQVLPKIGLYALVLAGAVFYRYRGAEKLMSALLIVFWMGLVSDLHVYPMFLAGRQPVEYSDAALAQLDHAFGLEVPDVLTWMAGHPQLQGFFDKAYYTLVFLMACALLTTSLLGKFKAAQEYVISCVCAVAICFPFFAVFQAQGPWTYYGYAPSPAQAEFLQVLGALKTDAIFTMDLGYASGLITFPSFHTILAALAGAALWPIPLLRWFGIVWAGLIIVSTVTTGWHYIIDVIAGLGVAALSVAGAKAFSWVEARLANAPHSQRSETGELKTCPT